MTPPVPNPGDRPELLAGHADGELDAVTRKRVDAWLAAHPAAWADLETQRRLGPRSPFWDATAAPEPAAAAWERVRANIGRPVQKTVRRWPGVVGIAAAAVAALVFLSFRKPVEAPWPVASADDVEIISLQDADTGLLVVGIPPVPGPVMLASAADVHLINIEADDEGAMPQVQWPEGAGTPMVVAPVVREP